MFALLFLILGLGSQTALSFECPKTITGIELRRALDRRMGPGFGILADDHSLKVIDAAAIRAEFPKPGLLVINGGRQRLSPGTILTDTHTIKASEAIYRPLQEYTQELAGFMNLSLPWEEQVIVSGAELRVGLAGVEAADDLGWHDDGDYMAAAVVLSGNEMQYRVADATGELSKEILSLPLGKTIIYSARRRAARHGTRSLLHRHLPHADSVLLIVRFSHRQDASNR